MSSRANLRSDQLTLILKFKIMHSFIMKVNTGWPQSHAPMLIKKVIVVTFIQIESPLQGLQILNMFAVCSCARANTKFRVPVDTIQ